MICCYLFGLKLLFGFELLFKRKIFFLSFIFIFGDDDGVCCFEIELLVIRVEEFKGRFVIVCELIFIDILLEI